MAVYRCNHCGHVAEEQALPEGSKISCGSCSVKVTLFPAAFYLKKIFERYQSVRRELEALRRQEDEPNQDVMEAADVDISPLYKVLDRESMQNTLLLATAEQHRAIEEWFKKRKIEVKCEYSHVDTSGFFDEAATLIGDEYALLSNILEQLRYGYGKNWTWLNIELDKRSKKDKQALKASLRQLYSYTFFARYVYQQKQDVIGLGMQSATPVKVFLTGGWLEWWAFIRILELCLDQELEFSCARGMRIEFQDQEARELDVVYLIKKANKVFPVIVECKTGEFRAELQKYSNLSKRLQLEAAQFIICNPDIDDQQAAALSAMYGLTFVNLGSFSQHLQAVLQG